MGRTRQGERERERDVAIAGAIRLIEEAVEREKNKEKNKGKVARLENVRMNLWKARKDLERETDSGEGSL